MQTSPISTEAAIQFLEATARYFEQRPTNGEDRAHWANVCNAENCRRVAQQIDRLAAQAAAAPRANTGCGAHCPCWQHEDVPGPGVWGRCRRDDEETTSAMQAGELARWREDCEACGGTGDERWSGYSAYEWIEPCSVCATAPKPASPSAPA